MITPTININGSSKSDLTQPRLAAINAIRQAIEALQQATPNGRDYPGDNDRCVADREVHYARINTLRDIENALISETLYIQREA